MKNTTEYNFLDRSPDSVSDVELMSLITGTKSEENLRTLLSQYNNNMNDLRVNTTYGELVKHGITHSKAIALLASFQIHKRVSMVNDDKIQIKSSNDCYHVMYPVIAHLPHEEFWIVILNRVNKIKKKIKVSQGGLSGTVIDTKIVGRYAIENYANSIIAFHNHPSGHFHPSEADQTITRKLKGSLDMLDVTLLDHLIITSNGYFSFSDEGLL